MNCQQANKIDIVSFLNKQGFIPIKNVNNNLWYKSPFRNETNPSFKVDMSKNVWYDFGEGVGGTLVDLVVKLNNCSIKEALSVIENQSSFSFHKQIAFEKKKNETEIIDVRDISNKYLLNYVYERNLNIDFVKKYCFEVHYKLNNKIYFGIGILNNKGGFEIRNRYFKGVIGKKAITSIFNHFELTSIFESWSDFIAYLTFLNCVPDENFIILNSTSMIKEAFELVENTKKIQCFFDNDDSGNKATDLLETKFENIVFDMRFMYKNQKDFNDFISSLG